MAPAEATDKKESNEEAATEKPAEQTEDRKEKETAAEEEVKASPKSNDGTEL